MAELIGRQSDDMDDELDEDDLNQITDLLEQIADCLDNEEVEMVDECKEPIVKVDDVKPEVPEERIAILPAETTSVVPTSAWLSSFVPEEQVAEANFDFLRPQQIRLDLKTPKKRRFSMFQEQSSVFEETTASRISKLRRLSTVGDRDVGYETVKPARVLKSELKTTLATIPSRSYAILNASSSAAGVIRAFCLWCNQKLAMSLCDWKAHYLQHTDEEAFYCTRCNVALASNEREHCTGFDVGENFGQNELNVFMCDICNFIQANRDRIVSHIKTEHGNESPGDHLKKVMLLPDLKPRSTPIATKYQCLPVKNRYQCVVRDCNWIFKGPGPYKAHFMRWHRAATNIVCPHCDEALAARQRDVIDFFGEVLNHLYLHGNIVNECHACNKVFSNDTTVLKHFLGEHGCDECRYRRDLRDNKEISRMDEILVLFECNLCEQRVDTPNQAIEHFLNRHKSHHVDFTLIQFVMETTLEGDTQFAMIFRGQTWKFQQHFVCVWCKVLFTTKGRLTRHYEVMHRSQHLLIELSRNYLIDANKASKLVHQNMAVDQYVMYYCWHCTNSNHAIGTFYSEIDEVYDHWSCTHAESDMAKPFRFTVAPLVRCRFCDVISTFVGMKTHQAEQHPTKPFVFENLIDRTKCGLCLDSGDDALVKHFETDHQVVLRSNLFNPITINRDTLKKLVELKGNKKRKCTYCAMVFELKTDFDRHHHEKHALLIAKSDKIYDNESIYLITGCCDANIQSNQLFSHFKGHNIASKYRLRTYYWETKVRSETI